jgi:hypothetical protein
MKLKINKYVVIGIFLVLGILAATMFSQKREGFEPNSPLDNYSFAAGTTSLTSSPFSSESGSSESGSGDSGMMMASFGKKSGCGCSPGSPSGAGPHNHASY